MFKKYLEDLEFSDLKSGLLEEWTEHSQSSRD